MHEKSNRWEEQMAWWVELGHLLAVYWKIKLYPCLTTSTVMEPVVEGKTVTLTEQSVESSVLSPGERKG